MRRLLAVALLVLVAGQATALSASRHTIDVAAGGDVGVVESLDDVDRLRRHVPARADVTDVQRDGRSVAWTRRGDVVHARGAGNYTLTYRLTRGRVDLVHPADYAAGNVTLTVDAPRAWTVEPTGFDVVRHRNGTLLAYATNVSAGTPIGVELAPPGVAPLGGSLLPFLAALGVVLLASAGVAVWRLRQPRTAEMVFWGHYRELRHRLILTLIPLGIAFIAFFTFRLEPATVAGTRVLVPVFSQTGGMAAQTFSFLQAALLPANVELIVTNPVDAILAEITVGLFLAVVVTSPIAAYHAARFLGPALYPRERSVVLRVVPVVTGLFLAGCLFSLVLIVPFAFEFLYAYGTALGALTFVTAQDFVSFTVLLVLAFGLSFELPVAMVTAGELGVTSGFWRENWRMALFLIFVFAAFVTPDGSGVTMMMVGLPLAALYGVGYLLVRRREGEGTEDGATGGNL